VNEETNFAPSHDSFLNNPNIKNEGTQTQITGNDIDELQQQVNNLAIERNNLENELNQERQAHSQSQEGRRLESDQQVLRDQLNEEMAARVSDRLPSNKKQITLQTKRRSFYTQSEKQARTQQFQTIQPTNLPPKK